MTTSTKIRIKRIGIKSIVLSCFFVLFYFQVFSQSSKPILLITYYSQSGNTEQMAEAIAEGAQSIEGLDVKLLPIDQVQQDDLLAASAIILGSPVYNANIAPSVQEFINSWPFEGRPLKDKIGAVFSTGGGMSIGEELVMLNLMHSMLIHGMILVGGDTVESAFGASAITGEGPFDLKGELDPIFLKKGEALGKRVAETVLRFR
ncbi:MAG: flavodoxin family protein [Cyclobacteriaceae bacterium]|uniref:flavodoxin family protein n=1 Tax=Algoriphagus marincola TaxID=264027 RepID=UPI0012DC912A|nr:flavodoxin family protein [Algoriphagus marincola]MCR9083670.1 flavodoxin family protein [Cyclobacteriaceae bacterium]